jgi:hypothetical protein
LSSITGNRPAGKPALATLCVLLATSLSLLAAPATDVTTSARESRLHDFFHEPFEQPLGYSMVLADAKDRVLDRFGTPDSQSSSRYLSRTSDERLWSTVLTYDGMTISLGESEDRTRSWLEAIEITSNDYPLRFGLRIGADGDAVARTFSASNVLKDNGELRFGAEIRASRTGTAYRPGEAVTVTSAMQLTITLDSNGQVSRILLEAIEL